LLPGSYQLIVDVYDSVGQTNYQDVIDLIYRNKKFSAFIHTDKGVYKPGDTVKFSIFCIDFETKPYNPTSGSVAIPSKLSTKTFNNISFVKGKHKGSFKLSETTAMGNWRMYFYAEGEVSTKSSDF
jgi:uncharacterized protein YfaS (alpha-2-macroglobulin family)